jgi:Spy/CpxP family protein refolding chaperone
MKTKLIAATIAVSTAALCAATFAADGKGAQNRPAPPQREGAQTPGVDRRQNFQAGRIGDGVKAGQITREEFKNLGKEQRDIRQAERGMKADGNVTPDERKALHERLTEAGKNIREEKHDSETRPKFNPASPGQLGTRSPGIDARQHNQAHRIFQGVRSGQLTPDETKMLLTQQKEIRENEREMKSDGNLTWEERKQLHHQLNEASRDIYREKHDEERMPWARGWRPRSPGETAPPEVDYAEIARWHHMFFNLRHGYWHWREAAQLLRKQELLARLERRFGSDGELTEQERARLRQIMSEIREELRREGFRR